MAVGYFRTDGDELEFELEQSGTHTIVVDLQGTATGSVTLTLSEDLVSTIAVGGSSTAVSIGRIGRNDRVTFAGSAGQFLELGVSGVSIGSSSCCGAAVWVLKPDGTARLTPDFVLALAPLPWPL